LCLLYNYTIIEDVSLSTSTPIGEENDTGAGMSFTGVDWNDDTLAGIGDDDRAGILTRWPTTPILHLDFAIKVKRSK
jgi:hypothetical protein